MSYQTDHSEEEADRMIPPSAERVPRHTPGYVNAQILRQTGMMLSYYAARLDEIEERLDELDREWDVERTLEANAATLSLLGLLLGRLVSRKWFALPGVVATFLLQHALQGWCPPLPVLRRLGYRTRKEIDEERYALKALRGDFDGLRAGEGEQQPSTAERADAALQAAMS